MVGGSGLVARRVIVAFVEAEVLGMLWRGLRAFQDHRLDGLGQESRVRHVGPCVPPSSRPAPRRAHSAWSPVCHDPYSTRIGSIRSHNSSVISQMPPKSFDLSFRFPFDLPISIPPLCHPVSGILWSRGQREDVSLEIVSKDEGEMIADERGGGMGCCKIRGYRILRGLQANRRGSAQLSR